jgi:hypothetical protein
MAMASPTTSLLEATQLRRVLTQGVGGAEGAERDAQRAHGVEGHRSDLGLLAGELERPRERRLRPRGVAEHALRGAPGERRPRADLRRGAALLERRDDRLGLQRGLASPSSSEGDRALDLRQLRGLPIPERLEGAGSVLEADAGELELPLAERPRRASELEGGRVGRVGPLPGGALERRLDVRGRAGHEELREGALRAERFKRLHFGSPCS